MPQSATLVGNVGGSPELRFTPKGNAVCTFSLACDRGKDTEGNKLTEWVRCTCWKKLAESVNRHIRLGQRVQVKGHCPHYRLWMDKNTEELVRDDEGMPRGSQEMTVFEVGIVPQEQEFLKLGVEGENQPEDSGDKEAVAVGSGDGSKEDQPF